MISSIRMQINGFPGKSFARTFSSVPRKITSGTEFRICVFPATRFVDRRFPRTPTILFSPPFPRFFPPDRLQEEKKRSSMSSPLSNGAQISNNRRNGIGNCSSFFFFYFSPITRRISNRQDSPRVPRASRFPLSIKQIAFNPSRSRGDSQRRRHVIFSPLLLLSSRDPSN